MIRSELGDLDDLPDSAEYGDGEGGGDARNRAASDAANDATADRDAGAEAAPDADSPESRSDDPQAGDDELVLVEDDDGPEPELEDLQGTIEAILFSTSEPVTVRQLAEILELPIHDVREAVENLRLDLVNTGRSFRLHEISGGLQFLTEPTHYPWVSKFHRARKSQRLSAAALETLSVIAYKQPISKANLESIRGVQCGPTLKTLLDRGLIRIAGREETIGKPLLYGTTPRFLETFGIASLKHLPEPELEEEKDN